MSEIEIGEYVRTEKGIIAKIIGKDDDGNSMLDIQQIITKCEEKKIKHSKNIKELIEVGDYVNGILIDMIEKFKDGSISFNGEPTSFCEVRNILTKEQFNQNCYEVEE